MQRAAASSPISSPQTPDQPSAKRQKFSSAPSPATPSADLQAIQAALAAEEAKRSEAVERQAAEAGETKWVLSFRDEQGAVDGHAAGTMRGVANGYTDIDRATETDMHDEEPWRPLVVGRRSFGKFNRAIEVSLDEHQPVSGNMWSTKLLTLLSLEAPGWQWKFRVL